MISRNKHAGMGSSRPGQKPIVGSPSPSVDGAQGDMIGGKGGGVETVGGMVVHTYPAYPARPGDHEGNLGLKEAGKDA